MSDEDDSVDEDASVLTFTVPAEAQESVSPLVSVIVTIVLLKVALI